MAVEASSGGHSNTPAERTEKNNKINILLDWVGVTFFNEELGLGLVLDYFDTVIQIPKTAWMEGRRNYEGYAYSKTFENINIYYQGQAGQGIHVDITGQGCRYIETYKFFLGVQKPQTLNWYLILSDFLAMNGKFTRIDMAMDDYDGYFRVPYIFKKLLLGEITMKFKSWSPDGYFDSDGQAKSGMTIYFGSDVSRFQICMYEKGKQLGTDEEITRTELRFRHERAEEFVKLFLAQNQDNQIFKDVGVICAGILKDYITFRDRNDSDSNKRRWQVSAFWEQFLDKVQPMQLATQLPDRSLQKIRKWLDHQVSKSLFISMLAYKDINNNWFTELLDEGRKKMKEKDMQIIEDFRNKYGKPKHEYMSKDYELMDDMVHEYADQSTTIRQDSKRTMTVVTVP